MAYRFFIQLGLVAFAEVFQQFASMIIGGILVTFYIANGEVTFLLDLLINIKE